MLYACHKLLVGIHAVAKFLYLLDEIGVSAAEVVAAAAVAGVEYGAISHHYAHRL